MAEGKKSFVLYTDLIHTVKKLPKETIADLFLTILDYVNDLNPEPKDVLLQVAFEPIKQQLKRDLKDWEGIRYKRSEAGKLGGISSGKSRGKKEANEASASKTKQTKTREANEAVNVTVTVTDTVNVNEISKKEIDFLFSELPNTSHIETIAITNNQPKAKILSMIPAFRRAADLTYPTPQKFYNHFKNWVNIQLKQQTNGKGPAKKSA